MVLDTVSRSGKRQDISGVASPKFWRVKFFDFRRATVFC